MSEDTRPIPIEQVRQMLSSAPPPPSGETMRCPDCFGLPSDPDCETCGGRLLVSPTTYTRFRTLAVDAAVASKENT